VIDAHHPGSAQSAVHFDAPGFELPGHEVGGAQLFETQFRVRMDVAPDRRDGARLGDDGIDDFHGASLAPVGDSCQTGAMGHFPKGAPGGASATPQSGSHAAVAGQHGQLDEPRGDMAGR
jgi:hypothetical protein